MGCNRFCWTHHAFLWGSGGIATRSDYKGKEFIQGTRNETAANPAAKIDEPGKHVCVKKYERIFPKRAWRMHNAFLVTHVATRQQNITPPWHSTDRYRKSWLDRRGARLKINYSCQTSLKTDKPEAEVSRNTGLHHMALRFDTCTIGSCGFQSGISEGFSNSLETKRELDRGGW